MSDAPSDRRGQRRHWAVLGVVCSISAAAALVLSRVVFDHLSINNDEAIYRLQADAIAHGHLFPPAPEPVDAFRPWLAAVKDGHYVLKYTPVLASLLAVSQLLTGGPGLLLVAMAVTTPAVTYLLAHEVFGNRRYALAAALIVAASPVVIVHSALVLPYLLTLSLLQLFAWGLLRGARTVSRRPLVTAGAALGLALLVRPYDALLFGVPVAVVVALRARRAGEGAISPRHLVWVAAPVVAAGGAFMAYNAVATGHLLTPPFSMLEPSDKLGFGTRRLYPTDIPRSFGWSESLSGVATNGRLLLGWVAGGPIVVAMAVFRLVRRRPADQVARWLAIAALVLVGGYLFFWGPYNAAQWGGVRYMGPFYFIPVLVPLAVLAGAEVVELLRRSRRLGTVALAVMTALSGWTVARAIGDNAVFDRRNEALHDLVTAHAAGGLVYASLTEPFLMHPSPVVSNRWDASGAVVYAVQNPGYDLEAAASRPGRPLFRLSFNERAFFELHERLAARLQPLTVATGAEVALRVEGTLPTARGAAPALAVTMSGTRRVYRLSDADPSRRLRERLVVRTDGEASLAGRDPSESTPVPPAEGLTVELLEVAPGGAPPRPVATVRVPVAEDAAGVRVMAAAGPGWTAGRAGPPPLDVFADAATADPVPLEAVPAARPGVG